MCMIFMYHKYNNVCNVYNHVCNLYMCMYHHGPWIYTATVSKYYYVTLKIGTHVWQLYTLHNAALSMRG